MLNFYLILIHELIVRFFFLLFTNYINLLIIGLNLVIKIFLKLFKTIKL